jgi:hypothetical protein
MLAIIHRLPPSAHVGPRAPGSWELAERLLIVRQIDWLVAVGASPIVIEIGEDEGSSEIADWILESEIDGLVMIPTSSPLGPRGLAERAGSPLGVPFIALPENVIGDGDLLHMFLKSSKAGAIVMFQAPRGISLPYGSVRIYGENGTFGSLEQGRGFAVRLASCTDARLLGTAAERGLLPARDRDHYAPLELNTSVQRHPPRSGVHATAKGPTLDALAYARIANATRSSDT